jgi:hypothetical protein
LEILKRHIEHAKEKWEIILVGKREEEEVFKL